MGAFRRIFWGENKAQYVTSAPLGMFLGSVGKVAGLGALLGLLVHDGSLVAKAPYIVAAIEVYTIGSLFQTLATKSVIQEEYPTDSPPGFRQRFKTFTAFVSHPLWL
ncbi:MAG: hypothetical protein P4M13_05215 [Alphaproteobacteria bacterium]|nr:hypothetical protein [Alphaproteobacteria bacterium]